MGAGASAVQHSGKRARKWPAASAGVIAFLLGVGAAATLAAALASLLVDSVLAKRLLWVAVAVAVAVGAGVWRAGGHSSTVPSGSDRLLYGSEAGSRE